MRASHERWDGGGYPDGLVGEAIPVAARIISACDAFNAMTTDRSYRKALPLEVAIDELHKNSGTQFAPDVVEALVAVVAVAERRRCPASRPRRPSRCPRPARGSGCWAGAPSAALDARRSELAAYRVRDVERRGGSSGGRRAARR